MGGEQHGSSGVNRIGGKNQASSKTMPQNKGRCFRCDREGHYSTDNSRRSMIFLRGRPLSCEVPSRRRDSVGGGGSSKCCSRDLPESTRFSGGGE